MIPSITFRKEEFLHRYLSPISKIADNISLVANESGIHTVCSSQNGGNTVLYTQYKTPLMTGVNKLNIPDVKKFIRLLDCIEEESVTLDFYNNHLRYSSDSLKFNYFLYEDSVMPKCNINPEKIKKITYDTSFTLITSTYNEVLKGSSIATDSDKVYFYTKEGKMYAELNDRERQNINNICYLVAEGYEGSEINTPISIGLENLRLLAGLKPQAYKVGINRDLKLLSFAYNDEHTDVRFIISGLVK